MSNDFLEWIISAFDCVPDRYKLNIQVSFDDPDGYSEAELGKSAGKTSCRKQKPDSGWPSSRTGSRWPFVRSALCLLCFPSGSTGSGSRKVSQKRLSFICWTLSRRFPSGAPWKSTLLTTVSGEGKSSISAGGSIRSNSARKGRKRNAEQTEYRKSDDECRGSSPKSHGFLVYLARMLFPPRS